MSKPLHVCVVGYGYWGPKLVRNFLAAGAAVSVCEQSLGRRAAAAQEFPNVCAADKDFTWFLDQNFSAFVIATPPETHFDLALRALRAGKHVLIEKPMALNPLHAQLLTEAAENAGVVLMVDHTFLYHPATQTIKALLNCGDLMGKLQSFESTRINHGLFQKDTNVFWDLAVHDLSILLHLVKERPTFVTATGSCHNPHGQVDIGTLTLNYASGFYASINVSWLSPVKVRRLALGGEKRTVVWDDLNVAEPLKLYSCETNFAEDRAAYRLGGVESPRLDSKEALRGMAEDFLACIANSDERFYLHSSDRNPQRIPVSSPQLGRNIVTILQAADSSLDREQSTKIYAEEAVE